MPKRLILFTSLPEVGGHSALTEGLVRLVGPDFDAVEIWCKPMPGHGHSEAMAKKLESMGCQIRMLADPSGSFRPFSTARWLFASRNRNEKSVFVALAMRHLSLVLCAALRPSRSVYYHITHDLNAATIRRLKINARLFDRLAFICPATFREFPGAPENPRFSWVPQASEMPVPDMANIVEQKRKGTHWRIGLLGRLTPEKGAQVMASLADTSQTPFELHVAGSGPWTGEFSKLAGQSEKPVRVVFHGAYDPAKRSQFLRTFFSHIDLLVVPSQDNWETLSMVALEAMQHGTPSLVCAVGGLISFGLKELGPAPPDVLRLVPPKDFASTLEQIVRLPVPDPSQIAQKCLAYHQQFYADEKLHQRWMSLLSQTESGPKKSRKGGG